MPIQKTPCKVQELWDRIRQGLKDVNCWALVAEEQAVFAAFLEILDRHLPPAKPDSPVVDMLLTDPIKLSVSPQPGKIDGEIDLPSLCWLFIPHSILSSALLLLILTELSGGPPIKRGVPPGAISNYHLLLEPGPDQQRIADNVWAVALSEDIFVFDRASLN